jgi:phage terminase large subunit
LRTSTATKSQTTRATLNPILRDFWTRPARNRVLFGGRSSSKSWDAAGFAIFLASNYRVKFLCVRQFQNKIAESVYTLLKIQIERFGLQDDFTILRDSIVHNATGSEFIFYGLWRHIDEIKSTEGVDVCWIEEAHNLTKEQWDILEPTLRSDASQFWIIFNPRLVTDFVYRRFVSNTPPKTVVRQINYTENPFLSQTILDVIEAKREEDRDDYEHIYLGVPRTDDDAVIIKRSWIQAAIDARKVLGLPATGSCRIGYDVADDGDDRCATVEAHGIEAVAIDEWKAGEDELLKSASRVHAQAMLSGAEIDYDSIGVGAFSGAHFKALNEQTQRPVVYHKFNASGAILNPRARIDPRDPQSPMNEDFYLNLKAQAWWEVAARFRNTFNAVRKGMHYEPGELISISSECDHLSALIDELSTPRRDYDGSGKVKVESKKDLAKREIKSPNKADAFIMAFAPRAVVNRAQSASFSFG